MHRTEYGHTRIILVIFGTPLRLVHQLNFGTLGIGSVLSTLGIIPSEFWYSWFTLAYFTFGTLVGTLSVLVVFCWYTSQLFGALESLKLVILDRICTVVTFGTPVAFRYTEDRISV